jgi:hypothetical protein
MYDAAECRLDGSIETELLIEATSTGDTERKPPKIKVWPRRNRALTSREGHVHADAASVYRVT